MSVWGRQRKVRSDKKRDIKPTISLELKDSIYRLAFITRTPVKDVCELLVKNALFENEEIIKDLSRNFRRDIRINNTLYVGHLKNERIAKIEDGETERISFRLTNDDYEIIYAYKQNSVTTASPGELTLMLYNGCIKFIGQSKKAISVSTPLYSQYVMV